MKSPISVLPIRPPFPPPGSLWLLAATTWRSFARISAAALACSFLALCDAWGQVSGRVIDAVSGAPLPGVTVTGLISMRADEAGVVPVPSQNMAYALTDGAGRFTLRYPVSTLTFAKPGYQPRYAGGDEIRSNRIWALESAPYEMAEVVLTAFDTRRLAEQDGAVSLISPAALRRDNPVNLAPALNRVPGVYFQQATFTTNRLTIRGIGSRNLFGTAKIRAYYDEIPLTNGQVETSLEDIDLSLIERVEVVRGPASSLYGAGLGGVVRLAPALAPFNRTFGEASLQIGSFNTHRAVARVGVSGPEGDVQLNFNGLYSDGFRENNRTDRWSLGLIARHRSGARGMVTFLAQFIHLRGFIPSSVDSLTYRSNPRAAAANWRGIQGYEAYDRGQIGGSWRYQLGGDWDFQAAVFSTFRASDEPRPFNILQENSFSAGGRAVLGGKFRIGQMPVSLRTGGEYFHEWYFWRTYRIQNRQPAGILSDNQEVRRYYNLFFQADVQLTDRLRLAMGINVNETVFSLRDFFSPDSLNRSGSYAFDPAWSPRLALSYALSEQHFARLSASNGFSPPTLSETLTPSGQVNPDIRPETGWSYEAGFRWLRPANRLSLDVNVFFMDVRNLLVARRIGPDEFIGVNAGRTRHAGLEAEVSARAVSGDWGNIGIFGAATLGRYRFVDFVDGDNTYSGNALTGTPASHLNGGIEFSLSNGLYGNLNGQWVAGFPMNDANTAFADGYALANVRLGWVRPLGSGMRMEVFGGIQNAFDALYAPMVMVNALPAGPNPPRYYYPGLPRNVFLGMVIRWEKPNDR